MSKKTIAASIDTQKIVSSVDVDYTKNYFGVDQSTRTAISNSTEKYAAELSKQIETRLKEVIPQQITEIVNEVIELNEEREQVEKRLRMLQVKSNEAEGRMANRIELAKTNRELDTVIENLLKKHEAAKGITVLPDEVSKIRNEVRELRTTFINEVDDTIDVLTAQIQALKELKTYYGVSVDGLFNEAVERVLKIDMDNSDFNNALNTGKPLIDYLVKLS